MKTVVEEIHAEFDTASEVMLAEANQIIKTGFSVEKEARLQNLGFARSKAASAHDKATEQAKVIAHYQQTYPLNKFITDDAVEQICKKYNLVLGAVSSFIGDVPEKNLVEIENFKVKEKDYKHAFSWLEPLNFNNFIFGVDPVQNTWDVETSAGPGRSIRPWSLQVQMYEQALRDFPTAKEPIKPKFEICAPEKDFNTQGLKKKGHKLVPEDPIVLCPVKGGYLVVSKWGIEASDVDLVNPQMN